MALSEEAENELKVAIVRADLNLTTKQAFWETPRNLAVIIGAVAAGTAAIAGLAGYRLGQGSNAPQNIIVHLDAPLQISPAKP